ncbi:MAG: hypothetical protein N2508_11435, partial [Anaerolineae bacterium]|nr:hypothetical protein [Anaerolineae bacterium]
LVRVYCLGRPHVVWQTNDEQQPLPLQPKPLHILAYLALHCHHSCRREELWAVFWPDKTAQAAANNLRQALWQLRRVLPAATLCMDEDMVQWNPLWPPWVDALEFERCLDAGDLDAALALYAGPFLPDNYDEWAQSERERLHLRYLTALESRAHRYYKARCWEMALADAVTLLFADPLNETAARLEMACHWALGQREAARRCYDNFRQHLQRELQIAPLPETTTLYQRILRGEPHPDHSLYASDAAIIAQMDHFSLLETLGAFRQGLQQSTAWAAVARGPALAAALRWQGRFHFRLGQLDAARATLRAALPLATAPDLCAAILADLAATGTGQSNYPVAESYFAQALALSSLQPMTRLHLLSGMGGLLGRMSRLVEARRVLEEAVLLARSENSAVALATACGNLGILLMNQGELGAARRPCRRRWTPLVRPMHTG